MFPQTFIKNSEEQKFEEILALNGLVSLTFSNFHYLKNE